MWFKFGIYISNKNHLVENTCLETKGITTKGVNTKTGSNMSWRFIFIFQILISGKYIAVYNSAVPLISL